MWFFFSYFPLTYIYLTNCGAVIIQRRKRISFFPPNWQDCKSANCKYVKCVLKDIEVTTDYYVNVKTRIWSGTFMTVNIFNNNSYFHITVMHDSCCVLRIHILDFITVIFLNVLVTTGHLSDHRADLQCWHWELQPWSAHYQPQTASSKINILLQIQKLRGERWRPQYMSKAVNDRSTGWWMCPTTLQVVY